MGQAKMPRSLRSAAGINPVQDNSDSHSGKKVSAVAGLILIWVVRR